MIQEKTPTTSNSIKAVIFDYDGVLVDSRNIGLASYKAIAEHFGAAGYLSLKEFQVDQKRRYKQILHEWGATTPEKIKLAESIYKTVHEKHHHSIESIPGIKNILEQLSKKYTIALVSGTYRAIIDAGLKKNNLHHYFQHIIGADDVSEGKPSPEGMLLCLKKLNIAPDEALYVGDMIIDILVGRSANVNTAILTSHSWNALADLKAHNPDVLLEKPEHIMQVLQ